jgi:hypothetical protein
MRMHSPPSVVVVQGGVTWAVRFAASVVVAITYNRLCVGMSAHHPLKPTPLRGAA